MHGKSIHAVFVSLTAIALLFVAPVHSAENDDHAVTCKDGTTEHAGKGACSHHGGVKKGGASASAHGKKDEHGHSGESHDTGKDKDKDKDKN